jgi:predicted alpha/beta hydrolase family esterase
MAASSFLPARPRALLRTFLRGAGRLAALPFAALVALILSGGLPSWSALAYAGSGAALLVGLATLPDADPANGAFASSRLPRGAGRGARIARPRGLVRVSSALFLAIFVVHGLVAGSGSALSFVAGPAPALLATLVDEGDLAWAGTRLLFALRVRGLTDDHDRAPRAIREAYLRLREEQGDLPAPLVPAALGVGGGAAPDLVMIEPSRERPGVGVVFLHGFAGSFVLPCATVARAFADARPDVIVACPSLGLSGAWWTDEGARVLRATLATVRARGVASVFLVGLSNGGVGLSRLAPGLRGELGDVAGVILVSGLDPGAGAPGRPTLVVHGTRDAMASFAGAQAYARAHGATLAPLEAGHFAMLVHEDGFRRAVAAFVRAHAVRTERNRHVGRALGGEQTEGVRAASTTRIALDPANVQGHDRPARQSGALRRGRWWAERVSEWSPSQHSRSRSPWSPSGAARGAGAKRGKPDRRARWERRPPGRSARA